ncbi:hypothetical protein [Govanella unica]|uniref:Uncharacterized protein n=1 Tax=Govanella unica TaxID=2975056 RepID=A0A9X3TYP5_9PROT|nr:hypothetical protein [Govania unica]MDA5194390.1 hypothetical protein [Govania unica]
MKFISSLLIAGLMTSSAWADKPKPVEETMIEIYHIVPGQHEAFLESIKKLDEINVSVGLPPRQLYIHSDGAGWDFVLIQPATTPADKKEALAAAMVKANMPSGPKYFFESRKFIQRHDDTVAQGPTTASDYLARR